MRIVEQGDVVMEELTGVASLAAGGKTRRSMAEVFVILDIRMPRLDGFGVVQTLGDEMPFTIFCTAHDEFALAAFDARRNRRG